MSKERLDYLDMAKGIGIFLVILGHIEYLEENVMIFIYSFHMPLFFVIGGILAYGKGERVVEPKAVMKKRAAGTMVPYISFSLMLLTMYVFEYLIQPERITGQELLRRFIDGITGYGLHTLWFLPVYFGAGSLFILIRYYFQKKAYCEYGIGAVILVLAILSLWLIYSFQLNQYPAMEKHIFYQIGMNLLILAFRIFLVLPFFWIGWHYARLGSHHGKNGWAFAGGVAVFALGVLLSQQASILDLHYLYMKPIHYVTAAALSLGLLTILKFFPFSRILSYLGRNSLIIMCTHGPMYVLYYVSLGMFFVRKFLPMGDLVFCVGTAIMVCLVEVPVIWIFNHCFSYLLGRRL